MIAIHEDTDGDGDVDSTDKFLASAISGTTLGRGVHQRAVLDAAKCPTRIVRQASGGTKYIGGDATVILNTDGLIVTTWERHPRNPKKRR